MLRLCSVSGFVGVCVCPEVLKEVRLGQHDLGEVESKYVEGQVVCEAELCEISVEGLSVEKRGLGHRYMDLS